MKTTIDSLKPEWKSGILSICLALFLISCDPGQVIRVENKTDAKASIEFVFNEGHRHYVFDEANLGDTLFIELDSSRANSTREYHFGIGTWKIQSSLDSLVAMTKRIELETWKSNQVFVGDKQIREFFQSRITGRHNELIEINLE